MSAGYRPSIVHGFKLEVILVEPLLIVGRKQPVQAEEVVDAWGRHPATREQSLERLLRPEMGVEPRDTVRNVGMGSDDDCCPKLLFGLAVPAFALRLSRLIAHRRPGPRARASSRATR